MTKVNVSNGNKIKSDIFSWDILKSDIIFYVSCNSQGTDLTSFDFDIFKKRFDPVYNQKNPFLAR